MPPEQSKFRRSTKSDGAYQSDNFENENPFGVESQPSHFQLAMPNGESRHVLHFTPTEGREIKGTVLFLHGYGGTAKRWQHVALWYTNAGFQVYSMDQAYHGENDTNVFPGWRTIWKLDSFETFVNDAITFTKFVEQMHPDLEYVLHGHSMGGLVWILALLRIQDTWKGNGAILCAPALRMLGQGISPNTLLPYAPWFKALTGMLDFVSTGQFPNPGAAATKTACLPVVQHDIKTSKRMFGTMLCVRFWIKFREASELAYNQLNKLEVPLFVLHGDSDVVTALSGSEDLVHNASSNDITFHVVQNGYHEIMNGPENDRIEIENMVVNWVQSHMQANDTKDRI